MAILKLTIDLMRAASEVYLAEVNVASRCDCVLLCMAIAIGEIERRPMSASKLSQYIGMPRATVMRKLTELHLAGVIDRPTKRSYIFADGAHNREHSARVIATLARRVRAASTELSNLGS